MFSSSLRVEKKGSRPGKNRGNRTRGRKREEREENRDGKKDCSSSNPTEVVLLKIHHEMRDCSLDKRRTPLLLITVTGSATIKEEADEKGNRRRRRRHAASIALFLCCIPLLYRSSKQYWYKRETVLETDSKRQNKGSLFLFIQLWVKVERGWKLRWKRRSRERSEGRDESGFISDSFWIRGSKRETRRVRDEKKKRRRREKSERDGWTERKKLRTRERKYTWKKEENKWTRSGFGGKKGSTDCAYFAFASENRSDSNRDEREYIEDEKRDRHKVLSFIFWCSFRLLFSILYFFFFWKRIKWEDTSCDLYSNLSLDLSHSTKIQLQDKGTRDEGRGGDERRERVKSLKKEKRERNA